MRATLARARGRIRPDRVRRPRAGGGGARAGEQKESTGSRALGGTRAGERIEAAPAARRRSKECYRGRVANRDGARG